MPAQRRHAGRCGRISAGTRPCLPPYAQLQCRSNFSFLTGASHPQELVQRAHALGYAALAITDEDALAGVVRAHAEAKRVGLHLTIGAETRLAAAAPAASGAKKGAAPDAPDMRLVLPAPTIPTPCSPTPARST